jgi:thiamine biosynthesis lipoprotein
MAEPTATAKPTLAGAVAVTRAGPPRHLRVERVMGMPVSIDVRDPGAGAACAERVAAALDEAFALLRAVDDRFSTYQAGSEVSRLARGELPADAVSAELREVLDLCERVRVLSDGAFDIHAPGLPLVPDPSGLVKGWAVERVARLLRRRGLRHLCVNAGGDVRVLGAADPASGRPWRVGVRDPADRRRIVAVVEAPGPQGCAVATSGSYERGEHVLDPRSGRPARGLGSATVVGPDLTFADAYATAALAMGWQALRWAERLRPEGYALFLVAPDGSSAWSAEFERYLPRRGTTAR